MIGVTWCTPLIDSACIKLSVLLFQLTVFHLDDIDTTNEIDQAILYALLKGEEIYFKICEHLYL